MTKANEPAFPHTAEKIEGHPNWLQAVGLTKREYFAAMAMQGLLPQVGRNSQLQDVYDIAVWSAQMADALIAELAKAEPEDVTAPDADGWIKLGGGEYLEIGAVMEVELRDGLNLFRWSHDCLDSAKLRFRIVKGGAA